MKLRDPRNDITILERNPAGVTHGWGVVFWDDLLASLSDNDPQSAREIVEHSFRWTGQVVDVKGKQRVHHAGSGYGICRRQLLAILTKRAIELGVEIYHERHVSQLPAADLIVAADGAGSWVRRQYADQFKTKVGVGRNKYIWLGTTKIFSAFTFGFVPTQAGWVWFHAYAFRTDASTFIVECTPETWAGLDLDKMNGADSLSCLEKIFEQHLGGHQLTTHSPTNKELPWLNFRTVTNQTWHIHNLVLVGDAAHTTHFTIGSGTHLAIEDAIALASALQEHGKVEAALSRYEDNRQRALALPRQEASLSAQWFENLSRYIDNDTPVLASLLLNRRSRLMPRMSPRLYCQLRMALGSAPVLMRVYSWVFARGRRLYTVRSQS
jgi:2-polyprenyl-6-methoxyphenol hydroxylase-like FAD-dependent oxidoreductase